MSFAAELQNCTLGSFTGRVVILGLVLAVGLIALTRHAVGFDSGYEAGFDGGYELGHEDGYAEGNKDGYAKGLKNGGKAFKDKITRAVLNIKRS